MSGFEEWVGGTGNFDDPAFWADGAVDPPPNPPPGPSAEAEFENAGDVMFDGESNVEAYVNADMTFDLSGGGYDLTEVGLMLHEGFEGVPWPATIDLTILGAGTLSTPNLTFGSPVSLAVADNAVLDETGSSNPASFEAGSALSVTNGGRFVLASGIAGTLSLDLDDGWIEAAAEFAVTASAVSIHDGSTLIVTAGDIDLSDLSATDTLSLSGSTLTATGTVFGEGAIVVSGTNLLVGANDLLVGATEAEFSAVQTLTVGGSLTLTSSEQRLGDGEGNELLSKNTVSIAPAAVVIASQGLVIGGPTMTIGAGASISIGDELFVDTGNLTATGAVITVGGTAEFLAGVTLTGGTTLQASTVLDPDNQALAVLGASTSLTITNLLSLSGAETLDIAGGGAVSAGSLALAIATAIVEGSSSILHVLGNTQIGAPATSGTLVIGNGGRAEIDGVLTIDAVAGTGNLQVGLVAPFTQAGSLVLMQAAIVGDNAAGTLAVGNQSLLTVSGLVTVGHQATGIGLLQIASAARATLSSDLLVADQAGSQGTTDVNGVSSLLTVLGDGTIGNQGNGTFTVENGGSAALSGDLTLAAAMNSLATLNVTGDASALSIGGTLTVGDAGQAVVNLQDGATLDPPDVVIAAQPAPGGGPTDPLTGFHLDNIDVININGGAELDADSVTVGDAGYGAVIFAGGALDADDDVTLAAQDGSEGQIIVDGTDASLDSADLTVGDSGMAELTVGSDDSVTTDGDAVLAASGGQSTVILGDDVEQGGAGTGNADWSIGGDLTVGQAGTAGLTSNASNLEVQGDALTIGDQAGSNGLVTFNAGQLTFAGSLTIGNAGKGELDFQLGASLATSTTAQAPSIALGAQTGATGSLIVSGQDTSQQAVTLGVGAFGKGSVQVSGGAMLQVSGAVDIASQEEGVVDTVAISGSSYLGVGSDLTVGDLGVATLQILGGSQAAVQGNATIGAQAGASAVVTVGGSAEAASSALAIGGVLAVGGQGVGSLLIQNGATVAPLSGGTGTIEIGATLGATGTLALSDNNSLLRGTNLAIGGTPTALGGAGTLSIGTGTTVDVATATLWANGLVALAGGTLQAANIALAGGTLTGAGTVAGDASGTGTIAIAAGQTLQWIGAEAGPNITFQPGTAEALALATPTDLQAAITGFAIGDTVEIANLIGATATFSAGTDAAILSFASAGTPLGTLDFIGTYDATNLAFDSTAGTVAIACFAAGTRLRRPQGETPVEVLRPGDTLLTVSGQPQTIEWIGHRRVDCRRHAQPHTILPIRIAAHAFAKGRPHRDLFLSPDHAVLFEDVLIPIKCLANGSTVAQVKIPGITYFHVELQHHDVVLAEGLPAETYLDTGNRDAFANCQASLHTLPDFGPLLWETFGYAPLHVTGAIVDRARAVVDRGTVSKKVFFFEKKNQKTFYTKPATCSTA